MVGRDPNLTTLCMKIATANGIYSSLKMDI